MEKLQEPLAVTIDEFIRAMPKVELHVHLEGAIQPQTLLKLAERNQVALPYDTVEGLHQWYTFRDFDHFVEIYFTICACIQTADDMEMVAREFMRDRARQRILYSEVIFTPYAHYISTSQIPFADQMAALTRARDWAADQLGVRVAWLPDISRELRPVELGLIVADWAISGQDQGIVGLGLGGPEIGNPPELFQAAFDRALAGGLSSVPHAGETEGPQSIWGAINGLQAKRIGHGVRCLEDPSLVALLRERQIPLDVGPTSNVCLGVVPSLSDHPLPRLLDEGLYVTLNSDDPPMFNTSLTDEYLRVADTFGFGLETIQQLVLNGVRASLLTPAERETLEEQFLAEFESLQSRV